VKLTDMKRTKADKKAEDEKYAGHKLGGEDYPYGLSISLDHHSLKKLGLHDKLPKVGSKIKLHAHAHVKSAREEQREGGKTHRHVELELRHMAIEHKGGDPALEHDKADQEKNKGMKKAMDEALAEGGGSEDEGDGENSDTNAPN
jgi:hypothetical protein